VSDVATAPSYEFDLSGGEQLFPGPGVIKVLEKLTGHRPHKNQARRLFGKKSLPLPSVVISGRRYTSERAVAWWIRTATALANNKAGAVPAQQGAPLTGAEAATLERFGIGTGAA
jgi:hypothetical protein